MVLTHHRHLHLYLHMNTVVSLTTVSSAVHFDLRGALRHSLLRSMPQGPVPYGTTLDSLARHSVDKRQRNRNKRWHTTLIMHTAPIDTTMATKAVYGDLLDDLIMEGDGEEELHILEHPLPIHYRAVAHTPPTPPPLLTSRGASRGAYVSPAYRQGRPAKRRRKYMHAGTV